MEFFKGSLSENGIDIIKEYLNNMSSLVSLKYFAQRIGFADDYFSCEFGKAQDDDEYFDGVRVRAGEDETICSEHEFFTLVITVSKHLLFNEDKKEVDQLISKFETMI